MAKPNPPQADHEAVTELFRSLPFEEQVACIKELQSVMDEGVSQRRAALMAELAELDELSGRPVAALNGKQAETGRTGKPAAIKYFDPKSGNHATGRGSWQKADWVKAHIEAGGTIEELLVSDKNPLPAHLQ